jgi:hypothetical protein
METDGVEEAFGDCSAQCFIQAVRREERAASLPELAAAMPFHDCRMSVDGHLHKVYITILSPHIGLNIGDMVHNGEIMIND